MSLAVDAPDRQVPPLLSMIGGVTLAAVAIGAASWSGPAAAALGGVAAGLSLALLSPERRSNAGALSIAVFDAFVVCAYGLLCNPALALWRAPNKWSELFQMTPVGAGTATALYIGSMLVIMAYSGRRPGKSAAVSLALIPFLFAVAISLGSNLPADLGRLMTFGADLDYFWLAAIGRVVVLFVFNEAIIAGASIALGRTPQRDPRLHGMLFFAAAFAAFTPMIASAGSLQFAQSLPSPVGVVFTALVAAAAQAGLWGETYLVTQIIADLLHGSPPIQPAVRKPWKTGAIKGAVYGFVFMLLVGAVGAFSQNDRLFDAFTATGVIGAAIAGALIYPLGRTIMESTDSTPPFLMRLGAQARRP